MTRPRPEPFVLAMPYNPAINGALRTPPMDTASLADHLAPSMLQREGMSAAQFYARNHDKTARLPPGNRPPAEPSYRDDPAENLSGREE